MANGVTVTEVQCYGMDETNLGGECYELLAVGLNEHGEFDLDNVDSYGWAVTNDTPPRFYCTLHKQQVM